MEIPEWLDTEEYPFEAHFFKTPVGNIHYVDEGKGNVVVFLHGNPSWSFQYRNLIKDLSKTHRCIAPDLIGFGLSDKPGKFSYLPKEQAENIDIFLESLDLQDLTLVVGDWGGPIGLSYALDHPERVRNIVLTNTWLWPVNSDLHYQLFSKFVGGPIGKWLINRYNFFAKYIVKSAFGEKSRLTPDIHRHYLMPLNNPDERKGCWVFPREIIGSSVWLRSLWSRHEIMKDKNILFAWGMKDIAFREKELNEWIDAFPDAKVIRFADAGHFVSEEKPQELVEAIRMIV